MKEVTERMIGGILEAIEDTFSTELGLDPQDQSELTKEAIKATKAQVHSIVSLNLVLLKAIPQNWNKR